MVKLGLLVVNDGPPLSVTPELVGGGPEAKKVEVLVTITVFGGGGLLVEVTMEEAGLFNDNAGVVVA